MIVIEMNPRVSPLVRAGLEGHRLPDRQDRRQARRRLHARRAAERHHPRDARLASSRPSTTWSPRSRASPSRNSPTAESGLTTQMKSVGEAMSIGRTFKESLQKGLRSLEIGRWGFGFDNKDPKNPTKDGDHPQAPDPECRAHLLAANRLRQRLEHRGSPRRHQDRPLVPRPPQTDRRRRHAISPTMDLKRAKKLGFSDRQIAKARAHSKAIHDVSIHGETDQPAGAPPRAEPEPAVVDIPTEDTVRAERKRLGIIPTYRLVDTCAAEFEAYTPYYYSTYGDENEARDSDKKKIIILGGGPNRIGQGIEFDYCCVHAAFAAEGTRLRDHHGQLQPGDRLHRLRHLRQALLRAAHARRRAQHLRSGKTLRRHRPVRRPDPAQSRQPASNDHGVPIIGTSPKSHRTRRGPQVLRRAARQARPQPSRQRHRHHRGRSRSPSPTGSAIPVLVRPSFVLGGRAMQIVYNDAELSHYMRERRRPPRPTARCSWTASSKTPPRWTSIASATARPPSSAPSWSTSKRPASTPATRACVIPPFSPHASPIQAEIARRRQGAGHASSTSAA